MSFSARELFDLGWDFYDGVWLKWLSIAPHSERRLRLQQVGTDAFRAHCQEFRTEKFTIGEEKTTISEAITSLSQALQSSEKEDDLLFASALAAYAQEPSIKGL